jgi:hypothetical protein
VPLAFSSPTHGTIAFGFFHIETPMLLLQNHFFWARDFMEVMRDLAATQAHKWFQAELPAFVIDRPQDLGDLHGAIAGRARHGFLGALYARWPFPARPEEFRQKPRGAAPRREVLELIRRFGRPQTLPVEARPEEGLCYLGEIAFDPPGLRALVDYVWRGGMPGWEDGQRPDWLWEAAEVIRHSDSPWLGGLRLDPAEVGVPV